MEIPGLSEWLIIFAAIVLLFGGKRLPELGSALGESIRNFRKSIKDPKIEAIKSETDREG